MSQIYTSPNTGANRTYTFRPLKSKSFKFHVKANANVNLCFSPTSCETPHQQFEIFLGGWGGGESAIRRNKKDDVCKVKTPDILNANQFRGFWIVITPHCIKIGKEGQGTPFLIHSDPAVTFNVAYYGYCTSYGTTGQWKFSDDDWGGFDMGAIGAALDVKPNYPQQAFVLPPRPYIPPAQPYIPPTAPLVTTGSELQWIACKSVSGCPAPLQVSPGPNGPYVATAYHNGGLIPGVVMPPNFNVCHIPWGGEAVAKTDFYLLSSPGMAEFVWQSAARGTVPVGAIQGGYSETGEPLYIGRFKQAGNFVSGKVHPSHRVCYVPYWGKETSNASYEVLCLKTVPLSLLGL